MSDLILYENDVSILNAILTDFIHDGEITCSFLTNKEGMLLTCAGKTDTMDTVSVAALITGSFAATVTIAHLIGESEFTTMVHRGKNRHIYIAVVDQERYLASIFEDSTPVEKIAHYATHYAGVLKDYLLVVGNNGALFTDEGIEMSPAPATAVQHPPKTAPLPVVTPKAPVEAPIVVPVAPIPTQVPSSSDTMFDTLEKSWGALASAKQVSSELESDALIRPTNETSVLIQTADNEMDTNSFLSSNTAYLRIKIREAQAASTSNLRVQNLSELSRSRASKK